MRELAPRRWVVDVGQHISGWVRLGRLGPAGNEITLTYGEWLDADGDVTQDHVAYPASTEVERVVTFQVDLVTSAGPDGKITNLVPESHPGDDRPPAHWPGLEGASGWGDAAVHVPWVTYQTTGDSKVLADQWESARRWVDFAAGVAAAQRHHTRKGRWPDPRPHDRFLWDRVWHFGEWLEAGERLDGAIGNAMVADHGPVTTAYLYRSASQLSEIARILGRGDEADTYAELAADVAGAWRLEFLADDGTTTPDTQATYARAMDFGLIPPDLRDTSSCRAAPRCGP